MAAVIGGSLRLADSFPDPLLPAAGLAWLYLITDILLVAAVAGIWRHRRPTLGHSGKAGLAIFLAGTLAIRVAALGALGYQVGALIALLGLGTYAIETLIRRGARPLGPMLWLGALACAAVSALGVAPLMLATAAGAAFGLGFVAAGVEMLRS